MFARIYGGPPVARLPVALTAHSLFVLIDQLPWSETSLAHSNLCSVVGEPYLPRLLVGRARTQELLGRSLTPRQTQLEEGVWWCFAPEEDLNYFLRQYEEFLKQVPYYLLAVIRRRALDPLLGGPVTGDGLAEMLVAEPDRVVLQHELGWTWWSPAFPDRVSGLLAGPNQAVTGLSAGQLGGYLRAGASHYAVDGNGGGAKPITAWLVSRLGYSPTEARWIAPWLLHLRLRAKISEVQAI